MKTIKWTGKAGDSTWSTAKNWQGGVPGAGANVLFSDGGTWTLNMAGVQPQLGQFTILTDVLTIGNARINLNAAPPKHGATTDLVIAENASLTLVNDAILAATNLVQVGGYNSGALTAGTLTVTDYSGGWSSGIVVYDGLFAITGPSSGWSASGAGGSFFVQVGGPGTTELLVSGGGSLTESGVTNGVLDIGNGGTGTGQVVVTDLNSALTIDAIYIGNGYNGTLTVENQASVTVRVLDAGSGGDGVVNVTSGATLSAQGAIIIGSQQVPVVSSMEITNHGSVYAGTYGLELDQGTLTLDPTAVLFGSIISLGGHIDALPATGTHGTVTLGQAVGLSDQYSDLQFGRINSFSSEVGATLDVAGQVTTSLIDTVLLIGTGHVVLSNSANHIANISLAGGKLTIAATGADGGATLSFLNAYSQTHGSGLLDIAQGASFTGKLTGLGDANKVDMQGFAFGAGVTDSITNGTLTLNDGSGTTSLVLLGTYSAPEFTFVKDATGGTLIDFHKI